MMIRQRAASSFDLPINLDRTARIPLQRQISAQLRAAIFDGRLAPGARLPSTRALAALLGVSRNVVVVAYDELFAEGYLSGRHGSGTYVEEDLPPAPPASQTDRLAPARRDFRWLRRARPGRAGTSIADETGSIVFRPGTPAVDLLPIATWRKVWRAATVTLPPKYYTAPEGEVELRAAVARWVGRTRGIACVADDIVITTGAAQALGLIARATLRAGDPVAVEEPGYPTARAILLEQGLTLAPVPADDDGLRVECLPVGAAAPLIVALTPSHQYPLGGRLPVARRLALLEWARQHDSLIVEDDYDSEFRFDAPPLPALMSLDREGLVAYIGTFAKTLAPSIRAGYLIVPPPLHERIIALQALQDRHLSWPVQQALLALLTEGHLERHIHRARRYYAECRAILRAGLAPVIDGPAAPARLLGLEAGLHACLELVSGGDTAAIVRVAQDRGVAVASLDEFYLGPPGRRGFVLGYGGLTPAAIARGAAVLAEAIGEQQ